MLLPVCSSCPPTHTPSWRRLPRTNLPQPFRVPSEYSPSQYSSSLHLNTPLPWYCPFLNCPLQMPSYLLSYTPSPQYRPLRKSPWQVSPFWNARVPQPQNLLSWNPPSQMYYFVVRMPLSLWPWLQCPVNSLSASFSLTAPLSTPARKVPFTQSPCPLMMSPSPSGRSSMKPPQYTFSPLVSSPQPFFLPASSCPLYLRPSGNLCSCILVASCLYLSRIWAMSDWVCSGRPMSGTGSSKAPGLVGQFWQVVPIVSLCVPILKEYEIEPVMLHQLLQDSICNTTGMKQEAKTLFYINRKLANTEFLTVLEGLAEARGFMQSAPAPDHLNNLTTALLDLFKSAKLAYIRVQCAQILKLCQPFLQLLPSRSDICGKIGEMLRTRDPVLRQLAMEIIAEWAPHYARDTSVYHGLVSRLKLLHQMSAKEKVVLVTCLRELLAYSEHLSSAFSNNILELNKLQLIPAPILLYFCLHACFETVRLPEILGTAWTIAQPRLNSGSKAIRKYMRLFVLKCCACNYLCVDAYCKVYRARLGQIRARVEAMVGFRYQFLLEGEPAWADYADPYLLQRSYEMYRLTGLVSEPALATLTARIDSRIAQGRVNGDTLLMTYFLPLHLKQQIEPKLAKAITSVALPKMRMLKMALVACNFHLAQSILPLCFNTLDPRSMAIMNLLLCYCEFRCESTLDNLQILLVVQGNLARARQQARLGELAGVWRGLYGGQQEIWWEGNRIRGYALEDQAEPVVDRKDAKKMDRNKPQAKSKLIACEEQLQYCRSDTASGEIVVPPCLKEQPYHKIYFNKQTLLDIFKHL